MVMETIALSVITVLLFLLMLTRKPGRTKLLLGGLTAVAAMASMVLFVLMQQGSGNSDGGAQLYVPCLAYLALGVIGLASAAASRRKLQADKAARAAAKAAKAKAKEAKQEEP